MWSFKHDYTIIRIMKSKLLDNEMGKHCVTSYIIWLLSFFKVMLYKPEC